MLSRITFLGFVRYYWFLRFDGVVSSTQRAAILLVLGWVCWVSFINDVYVKLYTWCAQCASPTDCLSSSPER